VANASRAVTYSNPATANPTLIGSPKTGGSGSGLDLDNGVMELVRIYGWALTPNKILAVEDAPEN
jgi:hypothetical protein